MCKGFCCANPPPTELFLPQPFTFYEGFKGGVGKSHGMALKWTTRAQHMKPMCVRKKFNNWWPIRKHDAQLLFSPPPQLMWETFAPPYSTLIVI